MFRLLYEFKKPLKSSKFKMPNIQNIVKHLVTGANKVVKLRRLDNRMDNTKLFKTT